MNDIASTQPLSAVQAQLLAGQLLSPDVPLCNMALACHIDGVVDQTCMQQAWDAVARDTDAFGIRVETHDDKISQSGGHLPPVLQLLDLSASEHASDQARSWMQNDVSNAIETDGVLGRAMLIQLAPARWIFYCNLHHIICDATSFSVLWRRLARTYFKMLNADKSDDVPVDTSSDFLAFVQQTAHAQTVKENAKPEYLAKLQDIAPPAFFGVRPSRLDTAATRVSLPLTEQRKESLAVLAALPEARGFGAGIGNVNVLLTLLAVLLYRIGAGPTQTIGLPLPQRQDARFRDTVGLFVETLPVQVTVAETSTFMDTLSQVREAFLDLLKNASAGDTACLDAQSIPAVFNYINAPLGDFEELPAKIEWLHSGHIDSQHLLRLQVEDWHGDGSMTLAFDFNDAVFDHQRRCQTIEAFWKLFDAMATDREQLVESVAIMQPRLIYTASPSKQGEANPSKAYSGNTNLGNVFSVIEDNCLQLNTDIAQWEGDNQVSYAALATAIQHCASQLSSMGVVKGSRVAVFLHRDTRLPQVLLGILACGGAYIPIDANQPRKRVADILSDSDPIVLISNASLAEDIDFSNVLLVDHLFDDSSQKEYKSPQELPGTLAKVPLDDDDIAYIIYTSGSTGKPKGVAVTHSSLANYCHWARRFYARDTAISMPLFTPVGFDLTVTSLFIPLMSGGTQCIYNEVQHPGVEALFAMLKDDRVDVAKLTPAHLSLMNSRNCQQSKRLSQLIVGGEDLPTSIAARVDKLFAGRVDIHNEYGPTEATVGCVLHTFDPEQDHHGSVPIGTPVADSVIRVLNSADQDQLPGCTGELYVGGPSLAQGYWRQNQLTESRFRNIGPDGDRFYQTGDLVRETPDGNLHCLGRADHQFKLRGHRIEPAEIESAVLQHPAITACVAVLQSPQTDAAAGVVQCDRCGLAGNVPGAALDESGLCELCRNFERYEDRVKAYFRPMHEFEAIVSEVKLNNQADYDCIMLLSGGKDSTYALAQLVDMGLRVLAFTLDNGFISDSAKQNAERVCKALNVEHRYGKSQSMNAIFLDSLQRYSNVCNGCFKTIYTLALNLACELNVNCIVTGLSRGQFFETRLSEEWFMAPDYNVEAMDEAIIAARKAYHRIEDVVSCSLETEFLQQDDVFERIKIVDFYRYNDVDLEGMYEYLDKRLPWVRPADTGRSTNCLINDTGIYVHQRERGFHNYAHPYSWDVRLGHKRRDEAVEELNDEIDERQVQAHLDEIGYELTNKQPAKLILYYVASTPITENEIRRWLMGRLPEWMVPSVLTELSSMPLNINGKVDRQKLPLPASKPVAAATGIPRAFDAKPITIQRKESLLAPQSDTEQLIARIWCRHLQIDKVSLADNFFALGGDSLMAIRITSELNRSGLPFRPADIFEFQTIAQLAQIDLSARKTKSESSASDPQDKAAPFSTVSDSNLEALSNLLNKTSQS